MKSSVIILAGGKSRRMGHKNKPFLKFGNISFIEVTLNKLSNFDDVIIVTNDPDDYAHLGVRVVKDILPHEGPLGGIYTGLRYAKYDNAVVVPCDTPFIDPGVIEYIASKACEYDGVVPFVDGYYQPLCAAYSKECIELFETSLNNGITKIIDLYHQMNMYYISKDEIEVYGNYDYMFLNINTPEDYDKYISKIDI